MEVSKMQLLVPVDFSHQSLVTLEQAINLAGVYNGDITIHHVVEDLGPLAKLFAKKLDNDDMKKALAAKLDKLARDQAAQSGVKVTSEIAQGIVHECIVEQANSMNATLIVMSTLETSSLKKRFIASNTLRVVKQAQCPVITIRGKEHRAGCSNLVVPLDLTKETKQKVTHAIGFAKLFSDTIIRLVSIIRTTEEVKFKALSRQMDLVREQVENSGVDCSASLVKILKGKDTVAEAIIAYARMVKGDCIVIMTQQEVNPTEVFLGSSAQAIINNSDIPVMSIVPEIYS